MRATVSVLLKFVVAALFVAGLAALAAYLPRGEPGPAPAPPTPSEPGPVAGLDTEPVIPRELFKEVRTVGKLDYNEGRVRFITARVSGRVDRVYADFTGIRVEAGDHLADIYSPDLYVAQGELLRALERLEKAQFDRAFAEGDVEAARTKLRLLGVLPEQIRSIEKSRTVNIHLTVYAPIGGTVVEKSVRAGQYVKEGDPLYRIADLDPIWLYLDVYESDLAWVRYGQPVDVTVEAYPHEAFRGMVTFIDPFLDDRTRSVKVRVNLANTDRRLKPAMYASALVRVRLRADGTPEPTGLEGKSICPMHPEVVKDQPGRCPVCGMELIRVPAAPQPAETCHEGHEGHEGAVPSGSPRRPAALAVRASAVLDTGLRKVVYRVRDSGAYELVEVKVGAAAVETDAAGRTSAYYPVLGGLTAGDRVVIQGAFLLDSQRQISGLPSLLFPQGQSGAGLHAGHGHGGHAPAPAQGGHKH